MSLQTLAAIPYLDVSCYNTYVSIIIKNSEQIAGIKESCKLAAETLRYIEPFVTPGRTTSDLDNLCEDFIRRHDAIPAPLGYMGYPKATCISINEVICHGVPGKQELKQGDIVNIDVTTILNGYYGDTSITFPVGSISAKARHLLDVTYKCLQIGLKQVRPGNHFGNIGYEIYRYAMLHGCTIVFQFTGHGVGIAFHEPPLISHICEEKNTGPLMEPGMIFTIEPMLCLGSPEAVVDKQDGWTARTADGSLSAQFEHTVLVNETGYEVLTLCGL